MFITWLLDQTDRTDRTGRFGKLIEMDINNACLSRTANASDIQKHFFNRHSKAYTLILPALSGAFKEFKDFSENSKGL